MRSIIIKIIGILLLLLVVALPSSDSCLHSDNESLPSVDLKLLQTQDGMRALSKTVRMIPGAEFVETQYKGQTFSGLFLGSEAANPFNHPELCCYALIGEVPLKSNINSSIILMTSNNDDENDLFYFLVNEIQGEIKSIVTIAISSNDVEVSCQFRKKDDDTYMILKRKHLSNANDDSYFRPPLFQDIYSILFLRDDGSIKGSNISTPRGWMIK